MTTAEARAAVAAAEPDRRRHHASSTARTHWTISAATIRSLDLVRDRDRREPRAGRRTSRRNRPGRSEPVAKKVARAGEERRLPAVRRTRRRHRRSAARAGRSTRPATKAAHRPRDPGLVGGRIGSDVAAVVKAVNPKLTTAEAKAFAGKMRPISSFSVYYFVIVNNHWGGNIEAPATKINGTVVPAGGVFDFWKVVGDLRRLPGTGPGNAIEGGKITVTGAFGGGICTTSTTLFNAAIPGRHGAARPAEPQRVHQPVSAGPRCHRVDRRQDQADDELQERHQVPDPDPADHHQRRQQAVDHVQDLERPERPESHGHATRSSSRASARSTGP